MGWYNIKERIFLKSGSAILNDFVHFSQPTNLLGTFPDYAPFDSRPTSSRKPNTSYLNRVLLKIIYKLYI
jgi:hypothetical protein